MMLDCVAFESIDLERIIFRTVVQREMCAELQAERDTVLVADIGEAAVKQNIL